MKHDKKLQETIRTRIKELLEEIASIKRQQEVWIERKYPKMWWEWGDISGNYFDDLSMRVDQKFKEDEVYGIKSHLKDGTLTQDEIKRLLPFNKKLDKYIDKWPSLPTKEQYKQILSDPEWIKITEMAKDILKKIDFNKIPKTKEIKTYPSSQSPMKKCSLFLSIDSKEKAELTIKHLSHFFIFLGIVQLLAAYMLSEILNLTILLIGAAYIVLGFTLKKTKKTNIAILLVVFSILFTTFDVTTFIQGKMEGFPIFDFIFIFVSIRAFQATKKYNEK